MTVSKYNKGIHLVISLPHDDLQNGFSKKVTSTGKAKSSPEYTLKFFHCQLS
jgi:hypothetical protein